MWPRSEPVYLGTVLGAQRPPWSGAEEPREAALGEAYGFLVARTAAGRESSSTAARAQNHDVVADSSPTATRECGLTAPRSIVCDAAEAGALDAVLCLCPDRLARAYA